MPVMPFEMRFILESAFRAKDADTIIQINKDWFKTIEIWKKTHKK